MPNPEILQEELRNQVVQLNQAHEMNLSDWASLARHLREAQEDLQGKLLVLTHHVEGLRDGTNPTQAQSEGNASLATDVDDLKKEGSPIARAPRKGKDGNWYPHTAERERERDSPISWD